MRPEMGADGAGLSCPGSSEVAIYDDQTRVGICGYDSRVVGTADGPWGRPQLLPKNNAVAPCSSRRGRQYRQHLGVYS